MKKLAITILLLTVTIPVFALNSSLALGYQEKISTYHEYDPLYVSIDLWQDFNNLRLYGNYTNEMSKSIMGWQFSPSQDYFTVGASYDFNVFEIKAEHMCQHSVVSGGVDKGVSGGYTKIEIKIGDKF